MMSKFEEVSNKKKSCKEIFKECTDTSYGAGVGLTAGLKKKHKINDGSNELSCAAPKGSKKTKTTCKCGNTTHQWSTHKECPINKTPQPPPQIPPPPPMTNNQVLTLPIPPKAICQLIMPRPQPPITNQDPPPYLTPAAMCPTPRPPPKMIANPGPSSLPQAANWQQIMSRAQVTMTNNRAPISLPPAATSQLLTLWPPQTMTNTNGPPSRTPAVIHLPGQPLPPIPMTNNRAPLLPVPSAATKKLNNSRDVGKPPG